MKKIPLLVIIVSICALQVFAEYLPSLNAQSVNTPDVFVGIDMAYGDSVAEAKRQIDVVSAYTNLFILGNTGITYNTTKLDETCQYIYDKGLNFIVFRDTSLGRNGTWPEMARKTWGDRFLGYYAFDELGGWQIDMQDWKMVDTMPANYAAAAISYVNTTRWYLDRFARYRNTTQFNLYTSDYALYWFDYEAGYDTVFAEFALNYNRQLNIALCRGAANMHGKDWGAVVTWKYKQPPYLESGEELYKDLVLAYENGAKYIILFDANEGWTQSVLKQEHLDALKRFWEYIKVNPRENTTNNGRVAYVLPKDYGYGFRGPDDRIWGFWGPDNLTSRICSGLSQLFTQYDEKLDIIYDYGLKPGNNYGYDRLILWNDSSLIQPTTSEDNPPPLWSTPTQTASSDPPSIENPSPVDFTLVTIAIVTVAIVTVPAIMFRKRQHCITFNQTGIGRDFAGTILVIDGKDYDKYGATFWWDHGSRHTIEFKSPLTVNAAKQYVLTSTNGLPTHECDSFKTSRQTTVTGNYQPLFKTNSLLRK